MIVSIPDVDGRYPVTAVGSPLNPADITSVVTVPVAVAVTAAAQAPEAIAEVPIAIEPLAIVTAHVGQANAGVVAGLTTVSGKETDELVSPTLDVPTVYPNIKLSVPTIGVPVTTVL